MKEDPYFEPASARPALLKRISWGAIFAGLVIILVAQLTLTMLGVAIGATTVDVLQNPQGLGISAAIWVGLTTLLSVFLGAHVAGRLSGGPGRTDGMFHGVVTWGVTTLVTLTLLTSALGNLVGGTIGMLTQVASTGQGAPGDTTSPAQFLAMQAVKNPELMQAITQMMAQGGPQAAPEARERVINLLTESGLSREQASRLVNEFNMSEQQIKELTERTESGVAWAAWVSFGILALSAVVAAVGGITGVTRLENRRVNAAAP